MTGGALLLFAWRAPKIGLGGASPSVSRESLLLSNNVLLMVAAASVLLGTLYPLVLDVLGLGKISVGAPYFDAVFVPLMTPAVFLMGIGPIARWKSARLPDIAVRLRWAVLVSVASALRCRGSRADGGRWSGWACCWPCGARRPSRAALAGRIAEQRGPSSARSCVCRAGSTACCLRTPASAMFIAGVTLVKGYETERDVRLDSGQSIRAGGYTFRFDGTRPSMGRTIAHCGRTSR